MDGNDHMQVFISHNIANKADARLLAAELVGRGVGVWFDEWNIRPGESITAGIEGGLAKSDVFVLIWSSQAAQSNWVGTEVRAYLRRRVDDATLRIVPIMVDETPLPVLVADYRGFVIQAPDDYQKIAHDLTGNPQVHDLALLLQKRLWELSKGKVPEGSPHKYVVCPQCGSPNLKHMAYFDDYKEKMSYAVICLEEDCKFLIAQFENDG